MYGLQYWWSPHSLTEQDAVELYTYLHHQDVPNLSNIEIHTISGATQDFLCFLLEPLLTCTLHLDFVNAALTSDPDDARAAGI
jgi:hypothetical protein